MVRRSAVHSNSLSLSSARNWFLRALLLVTLLCSGCGSGGSNNSVPPPPPPAPDFNIKTDSQSIEVTAGGSTTVQVSILAINGFSANVSITILGLPAGVTASPAPPFDVSAAAPQTVMLTAANSAALGTFTIIFQGTSGALQHTAPVSLQVQTNQLAGFTVTLNDSELSFPQGGGAITGVGLTLSSSGNSNFTVNFSISGLPSGVQAAFGLNPFPAAQAPTSLTLTSTANAALANYVTVSVSATRAVDGVVESANFLLNVTPPTGTLPDTRSNFVRTDGAPAAAVYDSVHNVVYSANPTFNRVDVISPLSGLITSSITVPTPAALALSPDGTHLFVGCNLNQILTIDTKSLQVVNRTSFAPLPLANNNPLPYYFSVQRIVPLANGRFLLAMINSPSSPPFYYLVEWDPVAGTFTPLTPPNFTFPDVREMAGSANGTKAILVDYGTESILAIYDSATDSFPASAQSPVGGELAMAANPTGTQFAVIGGNGLAILDNQLHTLALPSIGGGAVYGMYYSADGTQLLISYLLGGTYPIIETFDTTSFSLLGVAPAFSVCLFQPGGPCQYVMAHSLAADSTGLVFSSFDHGLVFEDASNFQNLLSLPVSVPAPTIQVGPPTEAPLASPLATTLGQAGFDVPPDVWFGNSRGTNIAGGHRGLVSVTAPASSTPQIVNVKAVLPDGWMALAPQAFSYGAEILFVGTTAAPPTGGVTLDLVGHGFFGSNGNQTTVTIGRQPAQILVKSILPPPSDQFPTLAFDHWQVQVPAGAPGPADIALTSPAGASSLKAAFTYLPGVSDYPSPDAFTNILYDSKRNRVYLSAGSKVDVFDASANQYLAPLVPPSKSPSPLFQGLALTPDASNLLVVNLADVSLEIINPDNPAAATEVAIIPAASPTGPGVGDVAATSTNKALVNIQAPTSNGPAVSGTLYELDLPTLAVTPLNLSPAGMMSRTQTGDKVFFGGSSASLFDAAANQWINWQFAGGNNGTASGDGHWFACGYTSLDDQLIEHTFAQVPEYFADSFLALPQGAVPGEKMNASGSLLYQPLLHGVDVIDVNSGAWIRRIALSEQVQFVQDAMALDEAGNRLFLITNAGLTVLQMDPPPLSIAYLNPASGPAAGGTAVTIRGSGFQPGATVTFGGVAVAVTFIDASTLQVTTPALPAGGARVIVSNPASSSYALDAAFLAN